MGSYQPSPDEDKLAELVMGGDVKRVARFLAETTVDLDFDFGHPLYVAAADDLAEIAALLLEHGADPRIGDSIALRLACEVGSMEVARRLLEAGADPEAEDGAPLALAASSQNEPLVRLLMTHGATPGGSRALSDDAGRAWVMRIYAEMVGVPRIANATASRLPQAVGDDGGSLDTGGLSM